MSTQHSTHHITQLEKPQAFLNRKIEKGGSRRLPVGGKRLFIAGQCGKTHINTHNTHQHTHAITWQLGRPGVFAPGEGEGWGQETPGLGNGSSRLRGKRHKVERGQNTTQCANTISKGAGSCIKHAKKTKGLSAALGGRRSRIFELLYNHGDHKQPLRLSSSRGSGSPSALPSSTCSSAMGE